MSKSFSFGHRIAISFIGMACVALLISALCVYALQVVVAEKDRVINVYSQNLNNAARLQIESERRIANNRGFLLAPEAQFTQGLRESRTAFESLLTTIRQQADSVQEQQSLADIDQVSRLQTAAADRVMDLRATEPDLDRVIQQFQDDVLPRNRDLSVKIKSLVELLEQKIERTTQESTATAKQMGTLIICIAIGKVVLAAGIAYILNRILCRQISSAVQHIQSSSNELQAAANQQTAGSREQATSTNEIAITIKELVTTAHQIAESAQRVAGIAEETSRGARSGDQTVQTAQEAITNVKRQVDLIVAHMLDLGAKSQQIGCILEIINELAEQTNILAINASIEAVGAGENGRRFCVVADEIRNLADRVGGSTKEIKSLIEDIRSAVHTTVMATESGSKAADAGTREFGQVSVAFQDISRLLEATIEASREIELSTKQQTTAVEQVNVAIANVAHSARESEVSSAQTLQTVSELTSLSRELSRLIQPQLSA